MHDEDVFVLGFFGVVVAGLVIAGLGAALDDDDSANSAEYLALCADKADVRVEEYYCDTADPQYNQSYASSYSFVYISSPDYNIPPYRQQLNTSGIVRSVPAGKTVSYSGAKGYSGTAGSITRGGLGVSGGGAKGGSSGS